MQGSAGRKDDTGKTDMTFLDDMPRAIREVARVLEWACAHKENPYERGSWQYVEVHRYRAALLRHYYAAAEDGDFESSYDDESGFLHVAHIAVNAMMVLELILREIENASNRKA